jgi:serpin B
MCSLRTFVYLTTLALSAAACAPESEPATPASPALTLDSLPRPLTAAERSVAANGNRFTFELLRQVNLDQRDSNVFISPLSASMALGMTLNGAAGATADEMRRTLGFGDASQRSINEGYRGLIGLLRGLDARTDMRVANAIFHRNDFPFEERFLETGRTWFDAEVQGLDFRAPESVKTINDWVNRSTNTKIPAIVDRIADNDVMFLINAVYFKARWRTPFDARATGDATFQALGGVRQPMKLMRQQAKLRYVETEELQAVDLLYGNSAFTMTVLLPKGRRDVNTLAEGLTEASWSELAASFAEAEIVLHLPKLKMKYERIMNDDLKALGMRLAFDDADFTRMSPLGNELYISYVKQKTFVEVDEEGTEAAAATVVAVAVEAAPVIPVMRVDRPFVFAIRERFSGTVLFVGKVVRMPPSGA